MKFSIVVPAYNEQDSLEQVADRVEKTLTKMGCETDFELLFVDDGSTDNSAKIFQKLVQERPYVRVIFLRRNFGKSLALMTGFKRANGRYVVTMDADLQDLPEEIPLLYHALKENNLDLVSGWRKKRQDMTTRRWGSSLYNHVVQKSSGLKIHDMNCGFKIYKAKVLSSLCIYGQFHRYIPLMAYLLGFKVGETAVSNDPRRYGHSKYATFRFQGAFDLISILFVHHFGLNPLHFFGFISTLLTLPSLLVLTFLSVKHLFGIFGFGQEYLLLNRPLFTGALTLLVLGVFILITGLIFDFFLHHIIRDRITEIIDLRVSNEIGTSKKSPEENGQVDG
ncbi:glycosyltransferase family 2 protein [Magnetococcales bacterium HHB-1]